jgi:hypothetical protein
VEDDVGPGGRPAQGGVIEDAALVKLDAPREILQVFPASRGKVIENGHPVAALNQRPSNGRAYEARPAGDEDCTSHGSFYRTAAPDGSP